MCWGWCFGGRRVERGLLESNWRTKEGCWSTRGNCRNLGGGKASIWMDGWRGSLGSGDWLLSVKVVWGPGRNTASLSKARYSRSLPIKHAFLEWTVRFEVLLSCLCWGVCVCFNKILRLLKYASVLLLTSISVAVDFGFPVGDCCAWRLI